MTFPRAPHHAAPLLVATLLAACTPSPPPLAEEAAPAGPGDGPRLVLLIAVDQLAAAQVERFDPLFVGGIRRLLDEGVVFTDAHHDHAVTETAPGHATIATGRHPRGHGIVANYWYDPEAGEEVYSVDDEEHGESAARLLAPTLGDWLREAVPGAKVFAASGKDRAAILLAGHDADGAFWYDDDSGEMEGTEYYGPEPAWLADFNALRLLDERFGDAWEALPVEPTVLERLGVEAFDLGPLKPGFPHVPGGADPALHEDFYGGVYGTPWLDAHLATFARQLLAAEELGADGATDLLALSFSAPDVVGHRYGPDSPEVLDTLLRLDRELAGLLELVDREVGLDRTIVALTADHGVAPLPELRRARGLAGRRLDAEVVLCVQRAGERLRETLGDPVSGWLLQGPRIDPSALEATGRDRSQVEARLAVALAACPSVERAWTRSELAAEPPPAEAPARLFANSFHPERSPDVLIQFEEYLQPVVTVAATHGSPYSYDTGVPLIVLAPGHEPGRVEERVLTADLAPTLAELVGVATPAELDGRSLVPRLTGSASP